MSDNGTEIKRCNGGIVAFGARGEENCVYARRFCACISPYQDEKYGKGFRVHNKQGGKNLGDSRCTVCGFGRGPVRP